MKNITHAEKVMLGYHTIITIIFVYVFVQFLTLKRTNIIFKIYADYILNKYCLILYILLSVLIMKYDAYTGILLLVLVIAPFKVAVKEYFNDTNQITQITQITLNDKTDIDTLTQPPMPTLPENDNRFKTDDIAINDILRQIKAQIEFDTHKTELSKEVIYEIYNKYFDNDVFIKLKTNMDDSKEYNAEGKLSYIPEPDKIKYDLSSYTNLSNNSQIGINPDVDNK